MIDSHQNCKVHIFWEGHKYLRNLHRRFDCYYTGSNLRWRFLKYSWPSQNIWTLQYWWLSIKYHSNYQGQIEIHYILPICTKFFRSWIKKGVLKQKGTGGVVSLWKLKTPTEVTDTPITWRYVVAMAIRVVKFSSGGYKIRKIFA